MLAESTNTQAVVAVPALSPEEAPNFMKPDVPMIVLTWVTFLLLVLVLAKLVWKPILTALDMREKSIRKALADAEKARVEAAAIDVRNKESLHAASAEARGIVEEARAAAQGIARQIQTQAEEQARMLAADARRDIEASVEEARLMLRRETGALAIEVAGKVIEQNMDTARNRELVQSESRELDRA